MSTIEITSQNAAKVVKEFKNYYDKARSSPAGDYKAYIVKADDGDRLERLKKLLDRNALIGVILMPRLLPGLIILPRSQNPLRQPKKIL